MSQQLATLGAEHSAYMSTPFDVGGILGAVVAGIYADRTGASGLTCIVMIFFAIPSVRLQSKLMTIVVGAKLQ